MKALLAIIVIVSAVAFSIEDQNIKQACEARGGQLTSIELGCNLGK